eukprot:scaffold30512_cov45-Phaeocystis_antarctica.AAC.1
MVRLPRALDSHWDSRHQEGGPVPQPADRRTALTTRSPEHYPRARGLGPPASPGEAARAASGQLGLARRRCRRRRESQGAHARQRRHCHNSHPRRQRRVHRGEADTA